MAGRPRLLLQSLQQKYRQHHAAKPDRHLPGKALHLRQPARCAAAASGDCPATTAIRTARVQVENIKSNTFSWFARRFSGRVGGTGGRHQKGVPSRTPLGLCLFASAFEAYFSVPMRWRPCQSRSSKGNVFHLFLRKNKTFPTYRQHIYDFT